jgi:hypothetical protein
MEKQWTVFIYLHHKLKVILGMLGKAKQLNTGGDLHLNLMM